MVRAWYSGGRTRLDFMFQITEWIPFANKIWIQYSLYQNSKLRNISYCYTMRTPTFLKPSSKLNRIIWSRQWRVPFLQQIVIWINTYLKPIEHIFFSIQNTIFCPRICVCELFPVLCRDQFVKCHLLKSFNSCPNKKYNLFLTFLVPRPEYSGRIRSIP